MKPTAVFLTVILFVVVSCNTRDNHEPITTGDNVLPQIPVKEEKAAPAPQPERKEADSPKTAKVKLTKTHINKTGIKNDGYSCGGAMLRPVEEPIDTIVWRNVEIEAEYPGGAAAWQRFLNRNLHYPEEDFDSETPGSALVQFVVDKEGNVSNVEAIKGSKALCAELVRVIKKSGKWTPAVQDGRQVRSLKMQPLMVRLEREG